MQNINNKQVWSFFLKTVWSAKTAIIMMLTVGIFWAVDLSVRPYILKIMLDKVSSTDTSHIFQSLLYPGLIYLFLSLLATTLWRGYGYFVEIKAIPLLRKKIAQKVFKNLLLQSHTYYQNQFTGGLANKINDLTDSIPETLQIILDKFFSHGLALMIAIYALWQVDYKFALSMIAWIAIFAVSSIFLSKKLTSLSMTLSEWFSTITGKTVDVLSNISSVRLFARKEEEAHILDGVYDETLKAERKLNWAYFIIWALYSYSFVIMLAFNLYTLIMGRQQGYISAGDFALVLTINISINDFLAFLTQEFSQFSRNMGKITQALHVLLAPPEIQDQDEAQPLIVTKGEIEFKDVRFHYKGTTPLFQHLSIIIPGGQKVGLVGYSGSGKTTFANIILRQYEICKGEILIDGQDIYKIAQDSLRSSIAMIPQEPSLFHRSILENIRYGRLEASDEEVIEAAKIANAHDFIEKLDQKYNTMVGERGVKLSGGQRQRIAIARAALKNSPILIMDEATSQLDSITEQLIQDALEKIMVNKTTLIIAHRLSTLLNMDRILVFDRGVIVEDGTHDQLLAKKGVYTELWQAQIGGFLPEKTFLNSKKIESLAS